MRPAIDLSHATHGRLLDMAEREDIGISEAYERALKAGLDELEKG